MPRVPERGAEDLTVRKMKKTILSIAFVAAGGIALLEAANAGVLPIPTLGGRTPAPALSRAAAPSAPAPANAAVISKAAYAGNGYKDGTYTGQIYNVYYGLVQVQAVVRNGQLASVQVLQYPTDRSTSRYINSQALPMLKSEVIQAQSANVNLISGATLTSMGFVRSLSSALANAKS